MNNNNNNFDNIEDMPDFSQFANNEESEENPYLSPEEYEELKRKNDLGIMNNLDINDQLETKISIDDAISNINKAGESETYSGLKIDFESMGRFSLPDTLYIGNYTTSDIQEIGLSRDEDIVMNLVKVLDGRVKNKNFPKIQEATIEEFYEILINMKAQYDSIEHTFHYIHSCQNHLPENKRQLSTYKVDLRTLKYRSVAEAEEEIRESYKKVFDTMTDQEFMTEYVLPIYKERIETTKEKELEKISIKEPFKFTLSNGDVIHCRLGRVKDLILGIQVASRLYSPKIRKTKNTFKANMKGEDLEEWKRTEIEKIELEKVKKAIEVTKSQIILTVNGKPFLNEEQRLNYYKKMDISDSKRIDTYFDLIGFGLRDEREMTCEHCGETERRSLHLEISPLEFLPVKDDKRDSTTSKISRHTISNFHFVG